jgi:hypothetical protein
LRGSTQVDRATLGVDRAFGATLSCIGLRGESLLKRDPANMAPAEDAFLVVAQQQKARSFELRAALDLARLYNSASGSADAHALLASALKGFSPTTEFPEIAEAQTLLAALTS